MYECCGELLAETCSERRMSMIWRGEERHWWLYLYYHTINRIIDELGQDILST